MEEILAGSSAFSICGFLDHGPNYFGSCFVMNIGEKVYEKLLANFYDVYKLAGTMTLT